MIFCLLPKEHFAPAFSLICTTQIERSRSRSCSRSYSHKSEQGSFLCIYMGNSSPSVKENSQLFVYLALLYNLCCLFLQLVQGFLVVHPCLVYLLAHRVLGKTPNIVLNGSYRKKSRVANHPSLPKTSTVSAIKVLQREQTGQTGIVGHPTCYNLLPRGGKNP